MRALVLGGGGPVGIAWELGVLAGLADEGVDLGSADRVVGTSAGAIVGSQIASGRPAGALYDDHLDLTHRRRTEQDIRAVAVPDLAPLMQFFMRRPPDRLPPATLMAEIGTYALAADVVPEADFLAGIGRLLLTGHGWPAGFACTAVEATTGEFLVWDGSHGEDLVPAVASSCAVPGLYPPVTIGPSRYVDGGIRSATNTDVAAGAAALVVLAVTVNPVAPFMVEMARRELATVAPDPARAGLVVPDAEALAAFGPNLMDGTRHEAVAAAGRSQGRREASRLAAVWRP